MRNANVAARASRAAALTLAVAASAALFAGTATAAGRQIPVFGEPAFCSGQQVAPVGGVLDLDSSCVLNLQITWLPGMKGAFVEFSVDGGASWQAATAPAFPVVSPGLVSGVGFALCNGAVPVSTSSTYLFRVHGFQSPNGNGSVFSAPFPDSVSLNCSAG